MLIQDAYIKSYLKSYLGATHKSILERKTSLWHFDGGRGGRGCLSCDVPPYIEFFVTKKVFPEA